MLVFSFINIVSARYRDLIGKIYRGEQLNPSYKGSSGGSSLKFKD